MWHCHPCVSPLRLQPFVATPSRLLPWSALIGEDITDSSPKHHLAFARANGVAQIVEEHKAEEARTKQHRDRMELIGEEQPCC